MRVILHVDNYTTPIVLDIVFRKTNRFERRRKNGKELIDTTCMIFRVGREIACATARHNPLDDYNKIVGKKIALDKAIAQIEFLKRPHHCGISEIGYPQRRIMRRHIWEVFHQTFGRWN